LFNLYPARIHVEICDQNSPHGLPVDSKLLTSATHRLAWAVDNSLCVMVHVPSHVETPENDAMPYANRMQGNHLIKRKRTTNTKTRYLKNI